MRKFKLWAIAIVALIIPTMVDAATVMPEAVAGVITLTEDVNLVSSYIVENNKDITLDLNGKTITSNSSFDTIYVKMGGKLTIKGNGKVINNNTNYACLFNNGTVVIDGAEFNHGTATSHYYIILNHGVMTIEDTKVSQVGINASLIENGYYDYTNSTNERIGYVEGTNHKSPNLTINGGLFDGGMNTIKNDDNAVLTINDGIFTNNYQVSVLNWNIATINGGTFNTPTGNDKTNIFVGNYGADSVDKGILKITGGTFNAEYTLEGKTVTPVEITGGTFNYTKNFINNTPERVNDNIADNNVKVMGGNFATNDIELPDGYIKYQNGQNGFVVINFDTTLEDLTLTKGETYTIDVDDFILENGEFSSSDTKIATMNKNIINAKEVGKSTITVKLDNHVKTINLTVVEEKTTTVSNPETSDNILIYLVLGILSITGLVGINYKRKAFK